MSIDLLKAAYADATKPNGLIAFTAEIRTQKNDLSGKYNCKKKRIQQLFSETVWENASSPSGHIILKNKITGTVINFSNHKDPVDPGAALSLFEIVQDYRNFLGNEIFCFGKYGWSIEPDYKDSLARFIALTK